MNVIESTVLEVLSDIKTQVLDWGTIYTINVKFDCYGSIDIIDLHFNSLDKAENVCVGYTFNS